MRLLLFFIAVQKYGLYCGLSCEIWIMLREVNSSSNYAPSGLALLLKG